MNISVPFFYRAAFFGNGVSLVGHGDASRRSVSKCGRLFPDFGGGSGFEDG